MSRGQPDFGMYAPKIVGAGLSDMAELAVRLGSIVEYDRRGDVIKLDDFESPVLKGSTVTVGGDSYVRLDTISVKSGGQSVKLYSGANINDMAELRLYAGAFVVGKWGIKISGQVGSSDSAFYMVSNYHDGTNIRFGMIKLDANARTISYLDSAGNFQPFYTGFSLLFSTHIFHNLKLVMDFENDKYERFMLNTTEWDLSSYALRKFASATLPHHYARFYIISLATTGVAAYLDDYVFTINEP